MSVDLSQSVRGVLKRVLLELAQGKSVARPAQQSSMQELQAWCEEHALETQSWFGTSTANFDRRVLARIEQTLAELGLHRLDEDIRQQDRFAQSDSSPVEHKSVGLSPKERRVLVAQANCGAYFPEWVNVSPSQWVMDIDWQTLELSVFPGVLVVENLDSFYQYFSHHPQRYVLPDLAQQALVIYRGDGLESRARKALVEAFAVTGKPVIYFGDYDSAGLNIAVHGAYSHIMLPSLDSLLAQANDLGQPAEQLHLSHSVTAYAEQLTPTSPLKSYLLHNTQQQKGLRQQAFKGPLAILPIT
ncbi:MAG TPA: hypothetical protein GX719_13300 [Gammaproteobacteria bacterium]|nr:hypothetical protein [Gammaproteobacteria bacterium]